MSSMIDKRGNRRSVLRKVLIFALPLVLVFGVMAGCQGPTGEPGEPGPPGEDGAVGPAGEDGSQIYSGQGAPADTLGTNGDYYLDRNTVELYGPKSDGGWGTPISLRGSSGEGEDGSQIYSGEGAPEASLGKEGDLYLDKANYDLYGPKTNSGWGSPLNLQGEDGNTILAGVGAPAADLGKEGDFYLDTSNAEMYGPKTDSGWGTPISLQGPQGPAGEDGEDGPQGPQGPEGPQGPAGEDGSQIYSGTGEPNPSLGVEGDYYLDRSSYNLYGPKSAEGWGEPINLKGTANVIYSAWTGLNSTVKDTTIDGSDLKYGVIDAPQVTQEILDQGAINVYMKKANNIYPLPYTSYTEQGFGDGEGNTLDFLPRLTKILITRFTFDNSADETISPALQYRYVLIPGGVAAKSKLSKEQIQKMSYEEITRRFGIRQ